MLFTSIIHSDHRHHHFSFSFSFSLPQSIESNLKNNDGENPCLRPPREKCKKS